MLPPEVDDFCLTARGRDGAVVRLIGGGVPRPRHFAWMFLLYKNGKTPRTFLIGITPTSAKLSA